MGHHFLDIQYNASPQYFKSVNFYVRSNIFFIYGFEYVERPHICICLHFVCAVCVVDPNPFFYPDPVFFYPGSGFFLPRIRIFRPSIRILSHRSWAPFYYWIRIFFLVIRIRNIPLLYIKNQFRASESECLAPGGSVFSALGFWILIQIFLWGS